MNNVKDDLGVNMTYVADSEHKPVPGRKISRSSIISNQFYIPYHSEWSPSLLLGNSLT